MCVLINQNFRTHNYIYIYSTFFRTFHAIFLYFSLFNQNQAIPTGKRFVPLWNLSKSGIHAVFPYECAHFKRIQRVSPDIWCEIQKNSAFHVDFQEKSIEFDGNGRISEHFVAEWATHNRHKRNFAAISQNISRPPVFTGFSYSVLSLIQYKNYDIILSES